MRIQPTLLLQPEPGNTGLSFGPLLCCCCCTTCPPPPHPAGLQTAVQDWPGRVKLWHVGVPPSGPMDSLHHRLANALVGNPSDAAALEFGLTGPTLRFHCDCTIALTGVGCAVSQRSVSG